MDALDGNAIGGMLRSAFGEEMTAATGVCATCGKPNVLAELRVYLRAPGAVGRCRHCGNVVMVLVERHEVTCVDLRGLAHLT